MCPRSMWKDAKPRPGPGTGAVERRKLLGKDAGKTTPELVGVRVMQGDKARGTSHSRPGGIRNNEREVIKLGYPGGQHKKYNLKLFSYFNVMGN